MTQNVFYAVRVVPNSIIGLSIVADMTLILLMCKMIQYTALTAVVILPPFVFTR